MVGVDILVRLEWKTHSLDGLQTIPPYFPVFAFASVQTETVRDSTANTLPEHSRIEQVVSASAANPAR